MPTFVSRSPWNWQKLVWQGEESSAAEIAAAVAKLAEQFPRWSVDANRGERLKKLAGVLTARRDEIIELIIAEAGKCRADARAEADALVNKIDITLNQALTRTAPLAPNVSIKQVGPLWRPRGVAAALGPFNFPLHLLHGLVVPALAVGCTVIAKPSEHCPALGELYRRCLHEAGLAEVCAVVNGGPAVAQAMLAQPAIATVALVGGRATGIALAHQLAERPEVVLALELGGVNHALVLNDADQDRAVSDIADGAWKMAGQRCTATRIAHVPRKHLDSYVAALTKAREAWLPAENSGGSVGRMISPAAREKFQQAFRSVPKGLDLLAGRLQAGETDDCRADPLLLLVRDPLVRTSGLLREEHFGPALIVDAYDDLDECLARIAANPYRLAASVHTASRRSFAECAARLPYGQVNQNRPTAGARSDQTFGGLGMSGNNRPAALAACQIFADESVVWPE